MKAHVGWVPPQVIVPYIISIVSRFIPLHTKIMKYPVPSCGKGNNELYASCWIDRWIFFVCWDWMFFICQNVCSSVWNFHCLLGLNWMLFIFQDVCLSAYNFHCLLELNVVHISGRALVCVVPFPLHYAVLWHLPRLDIVSLHRHRHIQLHGLSWLVRKIVIVTYSFMGYHN